MEYTRARKFWTDLRMELRPKDRFYKGSGENKIKYGHEVEAVIIKNKIGTNGKRARFNIYYDSGIDYESDLINVAGDLEVIRKAGSWYTYHYEKPVEETDSNEEEVTQEVEEIEIKKQGEEKFLKELKRLEEEKDYDIFEQIRNKVHNKIDNLQQD